MPDGFGAQAFWLAGKIVAAVSVVVGAGAVGRWITQRGLERRAAMDLDEGERKRVWARLQAEELKRDALQAEFEAARTNALEDRERANLARLELLEEIAAGAQVVRQATLEHRAEIAAARYAEERCQEALAEVRSRVELLEAKEARRARRDSSQEIPAGGEP